MTHDYGQPGAPVGGAREMNGLAIASFVLALVGLCNPLGILGLILGYVAKGQIRARNNSGNGLATAGIILGWISLIGFIIIILGLIFGGWASWDDMKDWKDENY
jgi:hypothetical protein